MVACSMVDVFTGYVAGATGGSGVIVKTQDNGGTWVRKLSGYAQLRCIQALSEQEVWAVGYQGTILVTKDGGTTWVSKPVSGQTTNDIFYSVQFLNSSYGYAT